MHRAIGITLTGADSSTPLCTNQQCCYCSERDARFRLNFVLANQRAYRPCLYLHQWTSCLVVRGVIEVGYQHNTWSVVYSHNTRSDINNDTIMCLLRNTIKHYVPISRCFPRFDCIILRFPAIIVTMIHY